MRHTMKIVLVAAVAAAGYGLWAWMFGLRFTAHDVDQLVGAHVRIGSGKARVIRFLDSRGWYHSGFQALGKDDYARGDRHSDLYSVDAFIAAGTGNNVGPGWLQLGHVGIVFAFDNSGRLIRYHVQQYYDGQV